MAVFAIGDLHLSLGGNKPMDIFGWHDHVNRLEKNWRRVVAEEDTVVLVGDTSWAMSLQEALPDFAFIHSLPGRKLISKGNHDYWWQTMAKLNAFLEENTLDSIHFLHNNCYEAQGLALCGTRGWLFETEGEHNAKVMNREVGRLRASLSAAAQQYPECERVAFLHYPPVYMAASSPELIDVMQEYGVKSCYYGHLHGGSILRAVQGVQNGIRYKLVSADALEFMPFRIK